jgi:hypothetical protein
MTQEERVIRAHIIYHKIQILVEKTKQLDLGLTYRDRNGRVLPEIPILDRIIYKDDSCPFCGLNVEI